MSYRAPFLAVLSLLPLPAIAAPVVYERVPDEATTQALLDKAVEDAAAQFSWAFRGIARNKLKSVAHACATYTIDADGPFSWQCEDHPAIVREDGTDAPWTSPKGKTFGLSVDKQGEDWITVFKEGDGGQRNRFRFNPDGTLEVTKTVFSSQLPEPMVWTVRYRPQG